MGKVVKKVFGGVSKAISGLLGGSTGGVTVDLPEARAAELPEDANVANTADVKIGADTLEDTLRRRSSAKSTFSSLGGSSGGISI